MSVVRIPHNWDPRPYQLPLWQAMEGNTKRAVAVWHRRAGKDATSLNWTASALMRRIGVYWHMLPTQTQGRKVVWDGISKDGHRIIHNAFPSEIVVKRTTTK